MVDLLSFQGRRLDPQVKRVDGALITAAAIDPASATFVGAVYDRSGTIVAHSLRPSRLGHFRPVDPLTVARDSAVRETLDEAIYAGHLFPSWGHFLFETLSTAWAGPDLPGCPVLFAPFMQDAHRRAGANDRLHRWGSLMAAAGWGTRPLRASDGPIRVQTLWVPERLAVFGAAFDEPAMHPVLRDVYRRIVSNFGTGEGLAGPVVARRPANHAREHPAEEAVYASLADRGMRVVDGATLDARAQVAIFSAATAVIGFSGSNLHNAAFARPGTPVVEITDLRSAGRAEQRNRTQLALATLLDQPYRIVNGYTGSADVFLIVRYPEYDGYD